MAPKKGQKKSNAPSRVATPSGANTPVKIEREEEKKPALVGINFGQSFSSIAVINKEGLADCIANDDGERQIATALSFNGEEEYSGVPARVQLVRNNDNTILAFRNLLGKTYEQVKSVQQPSNSAPIVDSNGAPAFTVAINGTPTTLTVHEVSVRFLKVLLSYASDFLGRKITGAVLSTPASFDDAQVAALTKAAEEAGIKVLQTIPESAAALTAYHSTVLTEGEAEKAGDKNAVVLDVGGTSTTATVVAVRDGLFVPLAAVTDGKLGGDLFDAKLTDWFGKEFTKKTKTPLEASNHRAQMKLKLAVEITKKSLSASNTAPCSVESLAEGLDFHGSVNRMRFDLLSGPIYDKVVAKVQEALEKAKVDPLQVQEVVLVGGTTKLPKLSDKLLDVFPESTSFKNEIESDEVIAKGAALQALSISTTYPPESADSAALHARSITESSVLSPSFLSKPIGFVTDAAKDDSRAVNGKLFTTLVAELSPLPLRRILELPIPAGSGSAEVLLSLYEGSPEVKVEAPPPKKSKGFFSRSNDDDDEDDEPEDIRTALVNPEAALGDLVVKVDTKAEKGAEAAKVRVTIVVEATGKGTATAVQLKSGAAPVTIQF
ncbi:protein of heat shock protein 70 family [Pseudohyphozyma bogoriensis]|nr:protein of heat shock protein 70 family [Pseudohyphozyma bogoriensis]